MSAATTPLARYLADEQAGAAVSGRAVHGLALVFHGWELAHCDAVS